MKNVSLKNLKHINKHLLKFQEYDPAITLNDLIILGVNIAQEPENLISNPSGRKVFEKNIIINKYTVRVRVVLNPLGRLRSVHIRD